MLEIKNLTKRYDETIIKNLNIILPSTGLIIIVGNSGCGKTTLLNLIGGIDQDYEGEILFDHQDIRKIKKYCRRHIGFIFQQFHFGALTISALSFSGALSHYRSVAYLF